MIQPKITQKNLRLKSLKILNSDLWIHSHCIRHTRFGSLLSSDPPSFFVAQIQRGPEHSSEVLIHINATAVRQWLLILIPTRPEGSTGPRSGDCGVPVNSSPQPNVSTSTSGSLAVCKKTKNTYTGIFFSFCCFHTFLNAIFFRMLSFAFSLQLTQVCWEFIFIFL